MLSWASEKGGAMDSEVKKALIYAATLLAAVLIWRKPAPPPQHTMESRYEIHSGGGLGQTFLLDRQTGAVWRYYRNTDNKGEPSDEGFVSLRAPEVNDTLPDGFTSVEKP